MDRFLQDQNIVLYRRLRNSSTGEVERRMIITLLRREMAKLKISKGPKREPTPQQLMSALGPKGDIAASQSDV